MTYEETLSFLYSCHASEYRDLRRIRFVLRCLGNPQDRFPSVLIAGTNGKGSVAKMLSAVLQRAGYRVGCYTSPHLLDFGERIMINNAPLSHSGIVALAHEIREHALTPLTRDAAALGFEANVPFFEIVTAMAFLHFARQQVDIAILEVGIGGRLDATNTVEPLVSVITNIGLDHQNFLGNTITAIAREKAGIIRPGGDVVTAARHADALAVILSACADSGAHCHQVDCAEHGRLSTSFVEDGAVVHGVPQSITPEGSYFEYRGLTRTFNDVYIQLPGAHQVQNASIALCALELLERKGFPVSERAIRHGLARVEHPGRLEVLRSDPLVVVDIAHNAMGARTIAAELPETFNYERLIVVIGILHDKDVAGILRPFLQVADAIIFTTPHSTRRGESAASIAAIAENVACELYGAGAWRSRFRAWEVCESVERALDVAECRARSRDLVFVTGSNYTVSEAEIACRRP